MIRTFVAVLAAIATLALWAFVNTRADPVVRRATLELRNWPADAAPVTVVLFSDIHIGNIAMTPERLDRIVAQVNALRPDVVVITGDFVAGHDPATGPRFAGQLTAPLSRLESRFGTVAVLGNHDNWVDAAAVRNALTAARVRVLENDAVPLGPLNIGGIGDILTGHARVEATLTAQRRLRGAPLLISHAPDIMPRLARGIVLAGHSHCGQVVLPIYGPLALPSGYGSTYLCGVIRERGRTAIVTAGLGTSVLPLRWGAPPDLWLLTVSGGARPSS